MPDFDPLSFLEDASADLATDQLSQAEICALMGVEAPPEPEPEPEVEEEPEDGFGVLTASERAVRDDLLAWMDRIN